MKRRTFFTTFSIGAVGSLSLAALTRHAMAEFEVRERPMPVLFVGHGSPMNAIQDNRWGRGWAEIGARLDRPDAIVCVSAHWQTRGVMVTAMDHPKTIHDFYGFPDELQNMQYPAPGSPTLARKARDEIKSTTVALDQTWGLDHGTWSVLVKMFPRADIPVIQLSLDATRSPAEHFELGKELKALRRHGVLIVGSGNIVHNLRRVSREHADEGFHWAIEFDMKVTELVDKGDHQALIDYQKLGPAAQLSVPTNEHYLPLLYALALRDPTDPVRYFNDATTMGSISMRSLLIG
jgi:4,5-DOPA dioxygenase extradiol